MDKLTIKEAGRYANFLSKIQNSLSYSISYGIDSKLYKEIETHKKSAAYQDHADEVKEKEYEDKVNAELNELLDLLKDVVNEKINLACEIQEAKKLISINVSDLKLDIDTAIEYAKILREVSSGVYAPLKNRKDAKKKVRGTGYAFNVEGNQTSYNYEVEVVTSVLYDKEDIAKKDKDIRLMADELSQEVDKEMSKEIVNHIPKFNYLDSIEDIIADYVMLS